MGSSVCKMNFYVPLGKMVMRERDSRGLLGAGKEITRYKKVGYKFFSEAEKLLKFRKGLFEVHAENEIYVDNKVHYYGINFESGDPVGFFDTNNVVYSPKMLLEQFDVSDIKAGRSIFSGLSGSLIAYVIGAALGVFGTIAVASLLGVLDVGKLSGGLVLLL